VLHFVRSKQALHPPRFRSGSVSRHSTQARMRQAQSPLCDMHAHTARARVYAHTHTDISAHIRTHARAHTCAHAHAHAHAHTHTHARTHARTRTLAHTHACRHIHTHTHARTHTHTSAVRTYRIDSAGCFPSRRNAAFPCQYSRGRGSIAQRR